MTKKFYMAAAFLLGAGQPTVAQVSDDVNVDVTIQVAAPEVFLSNLNDLSVTYDGTALGGNQADSFCIFAGESFLLTLTSSNGANGDFILAGDGSGIIYDVNIIADFDFEPITDDGETFDHAVTETIDGTSLSTDPTCSEGDNMLLEIIFPLGGANNLDVVTASQLSDGAEYLYQDVLTLTLAPSI